jgi:hypothetical protein
MPGRDRQIAARTAATPTATVPEVQLNPMTSSRCHRRALNPGGEHGDAGCGKKGLGVERADPIGGERQQADRGPFAHPLIELR